ncbi:MAG TPA: hypothetical protein VMT85_25640 [Thermoanaerobaculia bacterium]|nr:hypothetical protein [Thermoanaerobaculia bacterium]
MQRTARYFHSILISRAVWNFYVSSAVVVGLLWPASLEWMGLRVPSPAMWFLVVGGFIFVSGVLNVLASRHRVDYRPVLYNDIACRGWYILVYALFHALGHGHWFLLMIAAGDLLMIGLGLDFLRHYPKLAAAGSPGAGRA